MRTQTRTLPAFSAASALAGVVVLLMTSMCMVADTEPAVPWVVAALVVTVLLSLLIPSPEQRLGAAIWSVAGGLALLRTPLAEGRWWGQDFVDGLVADAGVRPLGYLLAAALLFFGIRGLDSEERAWFKALAGVAFAHAAIWGASVLVASYGSATLRDAFVDQHGLGLLALDLLVVPLLIWLPRLAGASRLRRGLLLGTLAVLALGSFPRELLPLAEVGRSASVVHAAVRDGFSPWPHEDGRDQLPAPLLIVPRHGAWTSVEGGVARTVEPGTAWQPPATSFFAGVMLDTDATPADLERVARLAGTEAFALVSVHTRRPWGPSAWKSGWTAIRSVDVEVTGTRLIGRSRSASPCQDIRVLEENVRLASLDATCLRGLPEPSSMPETSRMEPSPMAPEAPRSHLPLATLFALVLGGGLRLGRTWLRPTAGAGR